MQVCFVRFVAVQRMHALDRCIVRKHCELLACAVNKTLYMYVYVMLGV